MVEKDDDYMVDLKTYIAEIALKRIEDIDFEMRQAPERFPDFAKAREDIDREQAELIGKLSGDAFALEPLMCAIMAQQSELVSEVYKQAALDGGRVYRAFVEREIPRRETRYMTQDDIQERIQEQLKDLKTRQLNREKMPCPRCGRYTINDEPYHNALSRHADVLICSSCGVSEAFLDMKHKPMPLEEWACFTSLPPEG